MKMRFTVFLLAIVWGMFFSSCQQIKEDINEEQAGQAIVGSWQAVSLATRYWNQSGQELPSNPPYHYGTGNLVLAFKDNGTYFLTERSTTYPWPMKYQIRGNKLIRDGKETEFSINGNTLTLIDRGTETSQGQEYRWQSTLVMSRL